ncbi:N-acetyltransferase [bacterium D16-50]|nr:N-acetyltransferase [Lachnospiraceae bacterium]RKJ20054.1 N-acetyltransferase [bacterium D16-50]
MERDYFVHDTAIVSDGAVIGKGSKIWVNSQIRENVVIGSNVIISKDTYIDATVVIGNNVKIQNGVSVFHGVTIEDDVFVGPNVTFTNDMFPRAFSEDWKVYETRVCKGASIGANSTVVCGNVIGEYAMVGAGSVVTKDVPPHALVVGNPAKMIGYVCKCGAKIENGKCPKCGEEWKGTRK